MAIKDKKTESSTLGSVTVDKISPKKVAPLTKDGGKVMSNKKPISIKAEIKEEKIESNKKVEVSMDALIQKGEVDSSIKNEDDEKKLDKIKKSNKKVIAEKKQVKKTAKKVDELKEKLKKAKKKDAKKSVIKKVKSKLSDSKKTLKTKKAKLKKALKK